MTKFTDSLEGLVQKQGEQQEAVAQPPVVATEVVAEEPTEVVVEQVVDTVAVVEEPKTVERITAGGMNIDIDITQPEAEGDITDEKSFIDMVNKKFNLNATTFKDTISLFEKAKRVDAIEEELTMSQKKDSEMQMLFDKLPDELRAGINAWAEGKDYKSFLKETLLGIDYSKPSTAYGKDELIRYYNPDLTEEDMDDMSEREKKALYQTASLQHDNKHNEIKSSTVTIAQEAKENAVKFLGSVKQSTEHLKTKYQNINKDEITKIEQKMKTNIGDIFFNADNTYKEDAAKKIYFAEHGEQIVSELISKLQEEAKRKINKAKSTAMEEVAATLTNDKLPKGGGGGAGIKMEDVAATMMPPGWTKK
jgi:hypothetical protein